MEPEKSYIENPNIENPNIESPNIEKFYKDKQKYERMELVALKADKKPKCLYCKKPVGMLFAIESSTLIAECGAHGLSNGCDYKLEIDKDQYMQITDKLSDLKAEIAELEEKIIIVKFNHLFKFHSTTQTSDEFESLKTQFETLNMEYSSLLLQKHIPNEELISETKTQLHQAVNEMKTIANTREVISIQNTTIKELNDAISNLSYKHKEVISSNDALHHRLLMQPYTILSNEIKV
jgi:hypothetical protein